MRRVIQVIGASVIAVGLSTPAAAQEPKGLLQAIGSLTTVSSETQPSWGGAIGGRLAWAELTGEFGRMRDVTPNDLRDLVETGTVPGHVRITANYALLNVRLIPADGALRPFVTGGMGVARLDPKLDLGSVVNVFTPEKSTKPLFTAGAGLRVGVGDHVTVDGGYRYMRIYSDYNVDKNLNNERILTNLNTFFAALGVRF